ncbi:MAG TPA: Nif3-like dinuclear metal center hexameric protein [Nitrospirota bacterium]
MTKLRDIIEVIEQVAPPGLAEGWDNSGFQLGDMDAACSKVLVALDPLPEVFEEAQRIGAGLVVTHHPLFFGELKSLDFANGRGAVVRAAAKAGIALYAAHTSYDSANPGVSDALGAAVGAKGMRPLTPSAQNPGAGLGRMGELPEKTTVVQLARLVKERLGAGSVRIIGEPGRVVGTAAFCGGSGSSGIDAAKASGADVYITGDIKYHDALKAIEMGLAVLDAGHYATENIAVRALAKALKDGLDARGLSVEVFVGSAQREPWTTV